MACFRRTLKTHSKISEGEFIALIAMLMALAAFGVNMILPAFREMTTDLQLQNENSIQLTVSLLYLGMAVGQVFYGALSDNKGRKVSLAFGLLLFAMGCLVSFMAESLPVLLCGQIIQGIGLGAPRVVTMAVVRDNYEGNAMGRMMSFIVVIFVLVPTVSPYLGQGVIILSHWRVLYLIFTTLAIIMFFWMRLRLNESLKEENRLPFSLVQIGRSIKLVVGSRQALGYTLVLGLFSSAFIAYLNMSQQIFEIQYGLGTKYPLYFAVLSISIGSASFTNGKLVLRYGMERLSGIALWISSIISIPVFIIIWSTGFQPPLWMLMVFMIIVLFCFGILVANLNSLAMKTLGQVAGTGAAMVGALSTLISVPFAILIGAVYSGTVLPLIGGFAIFGGLSLVIFQVTKPKAISHTMGNK